MLKISPSPTFSAPVEIHVPGAQPEKITIVFHYRDAKEMEAWRSVPPEELATRTDFDTCKFIVAGWEGVDAPFSEDNLRTILDKYSTFALRVVQVYGEAIGGAKLGN